jgi:hypothetical protein
VKGSGVKWDRDRDRDRGVKGKGKGKGAEGKGTRSDTRKGDPNPLTADGPP